jgi:ubiquinone biosynthesis monooxygenase Coq7
MPNLDNILKEIDYAINIIFESKYSNNEDTQLNDRDKTKSQRVMRVNHMGEVCAQALYRGQALTTKDTSITKIIENMCIEEKNHLNMLSERLSELSGKTSRLNSLWYLSSFMLGAYVGTLEKNKSYGFIYETETQVEDHLDEYSQKLPAIDVKSKKILEEIKIDETKHKNTAKDQGSIELSKSTKNLMSVTSKVMKKISYYI